jgi:hypothetical protein
MTNVSTGQTRFYTPEPMVHAAARARSRCSLATWPKSSARAASRSTQSRLAARSLRYWTTATAESPTSASRRPRCTRSPMIDVHVCRFGIDIAADQSEAQRRKPSPANPPPPRPVARQRAGPRGTGATGRRRRCRRRGPPVPPRPRSASPRRRSHRRPRSQTASVTVASDETRPPRAFCAIRDLQPAGLTAGTERNVTSSRHVASSA